MTEIAPVRTVAHAFTRDGRCPTVPKMFFRSSLSHRKILTILLSLVWLPATTQALDIAEGWRFTKGDDPAWAQPEFDDSAWKPIDVGKPWEKAGHEGYDGYGWYRLRVSVPAAKNSFTPSASPPAAAS